MNYVVFNSNQIKLVTNLNPSESEDIKILFGRHNPFEARPSWDKFPSKNAMPKKEAATIIQNILNEMSLETHYAELRGASKQAVKTL